MAINVGWWASDTPLLLAKGHRFAERRGRPQTVALDISHSLRHLYCIGSSGSGKSRFLRHLLMQHILANRGVTAVDPHGDLFTEALAFIADLALPDRFTARDVAELGNKVVVIAPGEQAFGVPGVNLLQVQPGQNAYTLIDGVISVLKDIWWSAWGARMEDLLRHSLVLLQEAGLTFLEILPLLSNESFRSRLVSRSQNHTVRAYFHEHLGALRPGQVNEWFESSRNKASAFLSSPFIRPLLAQSRSTINFREILDQGKWLLINVSRDKLRESRFLVGALLVWLLQTVAVSREEIPIDERVTHHLLCDEFAEFYCSPFTDILTGSRKYRLALAVFHQTCTQPPLDVRPGVLDTVIGNSHTLVAFNVSRKDAERLAGEIFRPTGTAVKHQACFLGIPLEKPQLWSLSDERERCIQQLVQQAVGESFVAIRGLPREHPAPYAVRIPHVPDQVIKAEKIKALYEHVAHRYFRPLAVIEREIRERWQRLGIIETEPPAAAGTEQLVPRHNRYDR